MYLLTQSRGEVASWGPKSDTPRDDGNFTTGMENPITQSDARMMRERTLYVHTCAPVWVRVLAHLPGVPTDVHWEGAQNVIVWTVPLTWSESPLIIRPFAKFPPSVSLLVPCPPFPSLIWCLSPGEQCTTVRACTFDGNERWAKREDRDRKREREMTWRSRGLPNWKYVLHDARDSPPIYARVLHTEKMADKYY